MKEIYLDIKNSFDFKDAIESLYNKYLWLKNIDIVDFEFNGKKIDRNKKIKDIKLEDGSTIKIIEN